MRYKYKGKHVPLITDKSCLRLGFKAGYAFSSTEMNRATKCIVGDSIGWNGENTLDCTMLAHCAEPNANCLFDKDNYDIGLSYLIEEGIITKDEALKFSLGEARV